MMLKLEKNYKMFLVLGTLISFSFYLLPIQAKSASDVIAPVVKDNDQVVVMFMKSSCPYSQYLKPHFNKVANEFQKKGIVFKTIDITGNDTIYKKNYNFSTVPTVIYFKGGARKLSHGSNNKRITDSHMRKNIKSIYSV